MQPSLRMLPLFASASGAVAVHSVQAGAVASPVEQVVGLLTSMKADVEADAKADSEAYKDYECWCKTNKQEHTYQVENQSQQVQTLSSEIDQLVANKAIQESQISSGLQEIDASKTSLARATAIREMEATEHQAEAADMEETIDLLGKAIELMSGVQFVQLPGHSLRASTTSPRLSDLHATIHAIHGKADKYRDVMQKDLWEVIGSFDKALGGSGPSALNQQSLKQMAGPVDPIPGASDYTSRSNTVYGVLTQLKSDFEEDLAQAKADEISSQALFENLSAAKLEEIAVSKATVDATKVELTDTRLKLVDTNHDLNVTQGALAKDQQFLVDLMVACTSSAKDYGDRKATRDEEIRALGEALSMLMTDEARDLFATSFSFIQADQHMSGASDSSAARAAVQNKLVANAMQQILHSASRHKNWALAGLAVRMRLDSFTRVKEMLDKMMTDLKAQRKTETNKRDTCMKDIDETEDDITEKKNDKADLEATELGLTNDIVTLNEEIDALNTSVSQVQLTLKEGSEERKIENGVFQKAVMDQRNTINILEMTVERLKMFYNQGAFVQVHQQGRANDDPPAVKSYTVNYKKHNTIGGVFELLHMIITDATKMDTELSVNEQHAQHSYEMFVNDCMATVQADSTAINEKTIQRQKATAALDSVKQNKEDNEDELDSLVKVLSDYHSECDWLLKYYQTRQTALAEEIDAVAEAKAILSGAKFS